MSDDLTASNPSKAAQEYFERLLLGTPINILDNGEIKTYYLLDHEIEDLEKMVKQKTGKHLNN